jgi:hypothetical protein
MGWGEAKGPDAAEKLAAAVRKYKGWRSERNEEAMYAALAEYEATVTPPAQST